MKTVCDKNTCNGCMACSDICVKRAITIKNEINLSYAVIDEKLCVECGRCRQICPNFVDVEAIFPQKWYQGWARDVNIRQNSSSGGAASAIARAFIDHGGYVCSCVYNKGEFNFEITNEIDKVKKYAGSKYVKSNPNGIYTRILNLLKEKEKVLFIGLPCQVAALRNYVGGLHKELYTIDLICHGTPSITVLEMYLEQHGYTIKDVSEIHFRDKNSFRLKELTKSGIQDGYIMAFLGGLSFTDNCYDCRYAKCDRVSDVTLGDSWGSDLPKGERSKGISLILCQTDKGKHLIENAELELKKVDIDKAINCNEQLTRPSKYSVKRDIFMERMAEGKMFDSTVIRLLPHKFIKQCIKTILIRFKVFRGGVYRLTIQTRT